MLTDSNLQLLDRDRARPYKTFINDLTSILYSVFSVKVGCNFYFLCKSIVGRNYCNKCVLLLTHMLILNVCLTTSMHGLHTSTQHLDKTLKPLNWIRVCPSLCSEHTRKHSHVLHCVSCNISKYKTFNPHTCPSFRIYVCSTGSHLTIMMLTLNGSLCSICSALAHLHLYFTPQVW